MNAMTMPTVIQQHLIDPEVCIRCNTCEETCPVDAITHDSNNYVVDASICNHCMACVPPCPTGAIDHWVPVLSAQTYTLEEQFSWMELPPAQDLPLDQDLAQEDASTQQEMGLENTPHTSSGATVPPWSAAHPYVNLYTHKTPIYATVVGNYRLTGEDSDSDIHHIVLDFGQQLFPVLEGQSIAVFPPGNDASDRPYHARQYSIASPRNGERPGYNNLSLTVKRVKAGHDGHTHDGICSNYLCDLKKNDQVRLIGPIGHTFLMPNHEQARLLMICTGTGAAPMRAMTEHRRRLRQAGTVSDSGQLMLFFGARTEQELPYFGPLMNLPNDFIDINLALSRQADKPKQYVQDLMLERSAAILALLQHAETYIYVCGLKGMEQGVVAALEQIAVEAGLDWFALHKNLKEQGRIHFETY
ncbi:benzoyl-CoA 2,3-epoxidase subunit BoxA [Alcaligenes endophyticus]|uniref:Benzoyl-CoA oxygenase component A n=1 Tax=Alcaligenes endophyticus TaxID=1929088 RepID=A0ABT8EH03_9BURK|nr:benzoyl-CoA 2,3-epoxidase subunit BoxA [Alcaligenes endophyticus]MCX5589771.1 benzoyl-CoA 2,3-epoxidase subunit BoxA [Alcaligenes endophyticus]MDN4120566.1 benzoyl-CoA 2,3-epoxidase subunit BoxA [Alcaligenes endophyticus]